MNTVRDRPYAGPMRYLALVVLLRCGAPPAPSQACLPDWSWCVVPEIDGGARVIGAP